MGGLTGEEGGPVNSGVAREKAEVGSPRVWEFGAASVGKEVRLRWPLAEPGG